MSEVARLLYDYCDLTESQHWDLLRVSEEQTFKMNGARRFALKDLVTQDQKLTSWGEVVMARADAIIKGWRPEVKDLPYIDTRRAAAAIRKIKKLKWMTSPHVKLLWTLYTRPGTCYGALCAVYSYDIVHELVYFGMAEGERKLGSPWKLSEAGMEIVETYCIEKHGLMEALGAQEPKSKPRFTRVPEEDRRIARGDDFAGDAWIDECTGSLRWVVVGFDPNQEVSDGQH